ncbi:hypothetical protein SAMN02745702_02522 [Desulfobaculum bizertense DSM 18034]|uniref:Uncharacterized protein n=1 Tax=Desulfobaculum bizertense DSM 18034 TaxID=1121442 RepID=A0A1T4WPH3_9BACT|nr:hypothetical protein SAMN02745702_02522 [Desulfobaculum bizertense DSM 18034]
MAVFFLRKEFCAIVVGRDYIRHCFILIFFGTRVALYSMRNHIACTIGVMLRES